MKKTLINSTLILVFLGIIPLSCIKTNRRCDSAACECEDAKPERQFYIKSFASKNIETKTQTPVVSGLSYKIDEIACSVYLDKIEYAAYQSKTTDFSFTQSVMACSPVPPYAKYGITSLQVISNQTMEINSGDTVFENEDISDHFLISSNGFSEPQSLEKYDDWKYGITEGQKYWLSFNAQPNREIELRFTIKVTLKDGTAFELKDQFFKLRN